MTNYMKPQIVLYWVVAIAVIFGIIGWSHFRATRYLIISQRAYNGATVLASGRKGYPVESPEKFKAALLKYGVIETDFLREQGPVDFQNGFIFIVENGSLTEISHGNSGFDIAVLKPATNLNIAVVLGPRFRAIKVVGPQ